MSWKCLVKHKWNYFEEDIEFIRVGGMKLGRDKITIPSEVRLCSRCHKKQFKRVTDWVNYYYLTVEQERNKKLTNIGV
jgi:hypothetical protein